MRASCETAKPVPLPRSHIQHCARAGTGRGGHWFRQCPRPIHSARTQTTSAEHSRAEDAPRVFVVSLPPTEATLPSGHRQPHRCLPGCAGWLPVHTSRDEGKPLSPFVPAHRGITLGSQQTGRDCLPRRVARCHSVRAFARNTARTPVLVLLRPHSPNTAFGGWRVPFATSTWLTEPCTGLPNPEAAVVPALASIFKSEVTLLGRFAHALTAGQHSERIPAQSMWVCPAFRRGILSRLIH
jgi:hypothetical protein